jgi:hypothetical protein
MKRISTYLILVFVFLSLNLFSQETFPKSWEGNYQGELKIYGVDSVAMKLKMKLDIVQKTDSVFQWKITYDFRGKEDVRDYELVVVDKKRGMYKIDEKNSIVIDSYYKTDIFTSFFEVMNSYIISTYTKVNDTVEFEIISGDGKKPTISGNSKVENEDIPEVKSYLVNGRQKAVLKKRTSLPN